MDLHGQKIGYRSSSRIFPRPLGDFGLFREEALGIPSFRIIALSSLLSYQYLCPTEALFPQCAPMLSCNLYKPCMDGHVRQPVASRGDCRGFRYRPRLCSLGRGRLGRHTGKSRSIIAYLLHCGAGILCYAMLPPDTDQSICCTPC